jgi:outer membrane protein assembly factor BamB
MHSFRVVTFLAAFSAAALAANSDWVDYRGPRGDGIVPSKAGLPLEWSETKNVKWKTEMPLAGHSTPVVLGNDIWLTTATVDGRDEFVIRLDAASGKITLNEKLFHHDQPESLGNGASMNTYATCSPVAEAGRVYVHYGSLGTAALDAGSGKVLWKRDDLKCRHYRGASSSPVIFEDKLILTFDGADLQYHVALDKATGKTLWQTNRSVKWNDEDSSNAMAKEGDWRKAHSSPLIVNVDGKPLMLSVGAKAAYGYDPRNGSELWRVQFIDWSTAPRPVYADGLAYFVTGLTKKEMLAVKVGGQGDVTDSHIAWRSRTGIGKYASPLLIDGLLYTANDESFITCLDAKSGEVVWSERVGGKFAASPIYADGHMFYFDQQGKSLVVNPGRTYQPIATNTLASGMMASPAVAGKALVVRTKTHLYRIEQ